MNRRNFILSSIASLAAGTAVAQQAKFDFERSAIIRPQLPGVTDRMKEFALDGPFVYPTSPMVFNGSESRFFFYIPRGLKQARLVIFSHGALADPLSYSNLLFHWASHGFVVAAPLHDDAILESGPTLRMRTTNLVSNWNVSAILEDPENWKERVDRCVECLEIATEIATTEGFELLLDRTIIAGHGYGAYITKLLMGAEVNAANGNRLSFRDDRFFAGVCLSPQGPGIMGLDDQSLSKITSPMLFMISEGDADFSGQNWEARSKSFTSSAAGYKHLGIVRNGGTNLFNRGVIGSDTTMTGFLAAKAMSVCFLKAYADYDTSAFANMGEDFFERNSRNTLIEYVR
jgi:hypothetical protein